MDHSPEPASYSLKNIFLLLLLSAGIALFVYFRLYEYLSFENLKIHRQEVLAWKATHYHLALLLFCLAYTLIVACAIPFSPFFAMTGGFLFGFLLATPLVVLCGTLGALLIFLAIELALRDWVATKASDWLRNMEHGFSNHAFSYILVLRLIPIFPAAMINIVTPLLGVPKKIFVAATALGLLPSSLIYTLVGSGLGEVLDANKTPNTFILLEPPIFFPLVALAILIVSPTIYKAIRSQVH
jgi:uncharacterized membrane protein YdjX (TVP38/TMEM64 family)